MDYVYAVDYDYKEIVEAPYIWHGRKKAKCYYKDLLCAFDIETTRIEEIEQSVMYIWQMQIEDTTIIGRTWEEFINLIDGMCSYLEKDSTDECPNKIVIYVHNLSYEFQFLSGIYQFLPEEVFAIKSRKILKCDMKKHIEFRCSYLLTNMSLGEWTHKMGVKDAKLTGFDYTKKRYPWTDLTENEILYSINDVKGLVQALRIQMELDDDNLYTIPLTSTGYVRRDVKNAYIKKVPFYQRKSLQIDMQVYEIAREAFRGGDTHANRYYVGIVLRGVKSADRSSSYPDVIANCKFPMSAWKRRTVRERCDYDNLVKNGKAILCRVKLQGIKLRDEFYGNPYLSKDKCGNIQCGVYDNGRILTAHALETSVTDVDMKIIESVYRIDKIVFKDVYVSTYAKLPQPIIDVNIDYYRRKTELKDVEGQELYYMKAKNKLNSIYGMMAQNPVRDNIIYRNGEYVIDTDVSRETLLERNNKKAFLVYTWGVWVTAWARYRLWEGIQLAGDNFIYCDTDSVKYIGEIDWSDYNELRKQDSIDSGAYATDKNGKTHYMGVYEYEGEYDEFITYGAKKYAVVKDGKITTTIAGVSKKLGGKELEKKGGLKSLKPGFIFTEAGGNEIVYNDETYGKYEVDGMPVYITKNAVIRPSTYKVNLTPEYTDLLDEDIIRVFKRNYLDERIPV